MILILITYILHWWAGYSTHYFFLSIKEKKKQLSGLPFSVFFLLELNIVMRLELQSQNGASLVGINLAPTGTSDNKCSCRNDN